MPIELPESIRVLVDRLVTAKSTALSGEVLRGLVERGAKRSKDEPPLEGKLDAALLSYADTVIRHAYRVTDEQVKALLDAGHSVDAIFETTISAAIGAAIARFNEGMKALADADANPSDGAASVAGPT